MKVDRRGVTLLGTAVCLLIIPFFAGETAGENRGESLFKTHCAVCHPNGGNVLNPKKTLHTKDLRANNITTAEDIVRKIRNPGPFPTHPQDWAGMKRFDKRTIPDDDAMRIAHYILETFR
jgi:cytochrome c6